MNDDLGESRRIQPLSLQITEYDPDWGTLGDPAETTLERCRELGDLLLTGAWFLNPITTIRSPTDSRRFHQVADQARTRWRRTLTDNLNNGNRGYRRAVQKVVREAKEAPPEWLAQLFPETSCSELGPGPAPLISCSPSDRRRVRSFVRLRRQLAFSGIMFVDGQPRAFRDRGTPRDRPPEIREASRRCDISPLVSGTDLDPFMEISRGELRLHLAADPNAALYVTPGSTVVGREFNPAFLAKARKAESRWHNLTSTEVGRPRLRELARSAGEAAVFLFFHGTLVVDGLFFRPGRWPGQEGVPGQCRLDGSTVPAEILGLC